MEGKILHIVTSVYDNSSAPTNRLISIVRGLSNDLDLKVVVHFFLPNDKKSKYDGALNNVQFIYHWDKYPAVNKYTRWLYYIIEVNHFVRKVSPGSNILLFKSFDIQRKLLKRTDIRVFRETSEHPAVVPLSNRVSHIDYEKYVTSCSKLSGLFVMTNALKEFYLSTGISQDKIEIVNMTVDPLRFDGLKKEVKEKYIIYCGNGTNNKDGVDQLIKAFSIVVRSYPDIKLYVIGRQPDPNDPSSNYNLACQLGCINNVDFLGIKRSSEIPQLLVNATVCALDRPDSQQAKYGFPTKLGEYLLSGTPTVVTRVGDIPLFLNDKESALISSDNNPEEFASKLVWLLDNPSEAKVIGENGRQVALSYFNPFVEAKKISSFIFQ